MIVVVIIGLLASMAIPAFNKVRQTSRQKVVLNNLRMIAAAGSQYMLENGTTSAQYSSLVGTYFPTIAPVGGEIYTTLSVLAAPTGPLTVRLNDGTSVTFPY